MDGRKRSDVVRGSRVKIVKKEHQRSGQLTEGTVAKLLTKSANHPHGIKVMLEDGTVGRVQEVIE